MQSPAAAARDNADAACEGLVSPDAREALEGVKVRIAAQITGSLPDGRSVPGVPVFSVAEETLPQELRFGAATAEAATRRDVALVDDGLAFVVDGAFPARVADLLVALTEAMGYEPAAPGIQTPPGMRMNKSVHFLVPDAFSQWLFGRMQHLLPQQLDGCKLLGFSSRLDCYKYDDGDRFRMHTDGQWPGYGIGKDGVSMIEWPGAISKISLLLYLNDESDGVRGGATRLYSTRGVGHTSRPVDVQPAKGSILCFRHGYGEDSVLHEGLGVRKGAPKYVARINALYER
uniref:Prolyl 4-hydroxylase alpha subunit domain-containing protein n=1 Tax=Zooxanthella nutricula TaxID=1333877 RepID=A0A7S2KU04_9DINO